MMNLILRFVAFLGLTLPLAAQYVSSGGYTFDVDVRNAQFRPVYQARATVWVSGTTARVEVRADGYRDGRQTVFLRTNQKHYRVSVRLDDPTVFHNVTNQKGERVSARVDDGQFMSSGADWYRVEVQLMEEGYAQFGWADVRVRVNGISAFGERVQVLGSGLNRRVIAEVRRRDLRNFSNRIEISFPKDANLESSRRDLVRELQFGLLHEAEDFDAAKAQEKLGALGVEPTQP